MQAATEYWMDELVNSNDSTRERYGHYLDLFTGFVGMSSDELLLQRRLDLRAEDIRDQRRME
jgi:hypothetical protein